MSDQKFDNALSRVGSDAVFAGVSREDLIHLCIFLAGYQDKLQEIRGDILSMGKSEEIRKTEPWQHVAMHWPIIQGSRNQFKLHDIGALPYDSAAVSRAIHPANDKEHSTPKEK
jgi:hypothetical protein